MDDLERHVLASCDQRFKKVAMIIARAAERSGLADDHTVHDSIASIIRRLIDAGELELVGDLNDWRASEVRLADR